MDKSFVPAKRPVVLDPTYPKFPSGLPVATIEGGRYVTRFARTLDELRAIQRLRFEVFNLELEEGLDASYITGLDQDRYDLACHHIIVQLAKSGEVVGTYRVQTREMAEVNAGWYSASEFDLSGFPDRMLDYAVETGRACVAREHRNGRVLNHLWRALAAYMSWNKKRFMFGCCSLTSQDPSVAANTLDFLASGNFLHPTLRAEPLEEYRAYGDDFEPELDVSVKLPSLFASYLKLGAKIAGPPALDREFKTIDFLALIDVRDLDDRAYKTFFGR